MNPHDRLHHQLWVLLTAVGVAIASTPASSQGIRRRALVVGVQQYQNVGWNNLRFPAKDARDLAAVLTDPRIGGWATEDVLVLTDREVTRQEFDRRLERLLLGSGKGDFVLIYFSGHGFTARGSTYLALHDTDPQQPSTAIDLDLLRLTLSKEGAGAAKLLVLDACHSGAAVGSTKGGSDVFRGIQMRLGDLGGGVAFITSSGAGETSLEGSTNGLFTELLLKGLKGAATGDGPFVTLADAWDFVRENIEGQTPNQGGDLPMRLPLAIRGDRRLPPASPAVDPSLDLSAATKWKTWQDDMKRAYDELLRGDSGSLDTGGKGDAWSRFASNFSRDNPDSEADDQMRAQARARADYWLASASGGRLRVRMMEPLDPALRASLVANDWLEVVGDRPQRILSSASGEKRILNVVDASGRYIGDDRDAPGIISLLARELAVEQFLNFNNPQPSLHVRLWSATESCCEVGDDPSLRLQIDGPANGQCAWITLLGLDSEGRLYAVAPTPRSPLSSTTPSVASVPVAFNTVVTIPPAAKDLCGPERALTVSATVAIAKGREAFKVLVSDHPISTTGLGLGTLDALLSGEAPSVPVADAMRDLLRLKPELAKQSSRWSTGELVLEGR